MRQYVALVLSAIFCGLYLFGMPKGCSSSVTEGGLPTPEQFVARQADFNDGTYRPNLTSIYLVPDGKLGMNTYKDMDGNVRSIPGIRTLGSENLGFDEVHELLKHPPGFFQRHARVTEFVIMALILFAASYGGLIATSTMISTYSYSSQGSFAGYSRSYIPGPFVGGPLENPGLYMIGGLVVYYLFFSSQWFARFIGAFIDLFI